METFIYINNFYRVRVFLYDGYYNLTLQVAYKTFSILKWKKVDDWMDFYDNGCSVYDIVYTSKINSISDIEAIAMELYTKSVVKLEKEKQIMLDLDRKHNRKDRLERIFGDEIEFKNQ